MKHRTTSVFFLRMIDIIQKSPTELTPPYTLRTI